MRLPGSEDFRRHWDGWVFQPASRLGGFQYVWHDPDKLTDYAGVRSLGYIDTFWIEVYKGHPAITRLWQD